VTRGGRGLVDEGLILGRYRPLAELGEGGHGAVDLAFDTKMARRVAIKRIPITHRGLELLERTTGLKEARTAALLNHPNIVTVYEWDTDDDEAFLIMEHVDGASLAEVLDACAPLDRDEAAAVLAPIAGALSFAHDNGVLHLDLKPENVLVTRDGLVKVGDFGVASLTNAAGQAISAGGTLGYMPPEQLRGFPVDARTDIWAFAAVAFEVLTGTLPFGADTLERALRGAEGGPPPSVIEFEPALSRAVDDALADALAPDPDDRPNRIAEVADGLLALLGDPVAGRDGLADLVGELVSEEGPYDEESLARLGVWDRLAMRSTLATRTVVTVASAYLAWAGMEPLGLGWAATFAAIAIAAAAGWFAPPLGLAAGLVLLAAGGFATSPALGAVLGAAGALWWVAVCRTRPAAGAVPAFAPVAAPLGAAAALPLVAGFFVDGVLPAGAAGAASGLALAVLRAGTLAVSSEISPLRLIAQPLPFLAIVDWRASAVPVVVTTVAFGLAGVLTALGARRGTRVGAALGSFGGLLAVASALAPWVTGSSQWETPAVLQIALALILMTVVIVLGPPLPAEQTDDDVETHG
jgi:eukaryotic-like serine/threonine-protein kinase